MEDTPSLQERVEALIAGYEHGLNHNAPRTEAELTELRELLGHPRPGPNIPAGSPPSIWEDED
jgi:hypothetical protein